MEKNNRGLLITLIILLSLIVVLLSGILIFSLSESSLSFLHIPMKTETICDESFSAEEISNIFIDSEAGDIIVKNSTDGNIRLVAEGLNKEGFYADTDGNILKISSEEIEKYRFFHFNSLKGTEITLYIPKDFNALDISLNFGDIEIDDSLNTNLTIENNMGDIEAKRLGGSFNLHTDMGNIEIKHADITANSSATTSMGDIEINRADGVNINAKTSMGDCDVKNNTPTSNIILTAETAMGDVEIND